MHLVPSLGRGGMENGVVNVCNHLNPDSFATLICSLAPSVTLAERSLRPIHVVARTMGNDPSVPWRLAKLLRRQRIEILHTHCWGSLLEGMIAARLGGVAVVVHGEHGTMETRRRNLLIQRWAWKRVDKVVSVASPLADKLAGKIGFSRDEIEVIPNGVDTDTFRPLEVGKLQLRERLHLPASELLIGTVARLVPVKNHAGILHAFARLIESRKRIHLVLVGDGPARQSLVRLAGELQIADRVHFTGETDDVRSFLNALDLFVLNSHSEGMSNTVLEAMACGLPVIATRVGANPQMLEDGRCGALIAPDDHHELYRGLMEFAENKQRRDDLGQAARRKVIDEYSIAKMVAAYQDLYLRLLEPGRRRPIRDAGNPRSSRKNEPAYTGSR